MLEILLQILKGVAVWLTHYYSPSEVQLRRKIKKSQKTKEERQEINEAIHDEALHDVARIISDKLSSSVRKPDSVSSRWRRGFSSIGVHLPGNPPIEREPGDPEVRRSSEPE